MFSIIILFLDLIPTMADPLSTASGVLALAAFAFQSSQVRYNIVISFQSSQRAVRELKEELEVLNGALKHCKKLLPT